MSLIDLLLNIAGVLLWMNWRALPYDALHTATPATLVGTLRRAEPYRLQRWHFLAALAGLILARALFYNVLGSALEWTGTLNLLATSVAFRSDSLRMMLLFSTLSFAVWLGAFLLWLLLLSLLGQGGGEGILPMRLARAHLGWVVDWSPWKKWLLPFVGCAVLWWLATWPLGHWGLISNPRSEVTRLAQAGLVGLGSYLVWKYLLVALLTLHLLHNHIYFGRHALWNFVDHAGRWLLRPLKFLPLRVGKLDLAPLLALALVLGFCHAVEHGVRSRSRLDVNGRPERPNFEIPGLAALYERISK